MNRKNDIYVDLLYPSKEKYEQMKERRKLLSALPQEFMNDLCTDTAAAFLSPDNPNVSKRLFTEVCNDSEIINYRLDVLDDVLKMPRFLPLLEKTVRTILENERINSDQQTDPHTFSALGEHIGALKDFRDAVIKFCGYCGTDEGKSAASSAVKNLISYFEGIHSSKSFADMCTDLTELEEAFSKRIRCISVAINFNEEMRPVSAGIIGWSYIAATEKPSVFDRMIYRNAKFADVNVKNLHDRYKADQSEAEHALFTELEKITSDYIFRLNRAMKDYDCIDLTGLNGLSEQINFFENAARLVDLARSRGLEMCRPVLLPPEERRLEAKNIFDIMYFRKAASAGREVITNDISMDGSARFWLLSGANNGGKTTFVRAVGICQLFAQTGLYVPASECAVSPADHIYTHFPKEEEVGIDSSRFTTEIKSLRAIADSATEYSLLLMNESLQSTTPTECVEIAGEMLHIFTMIGVRGVFATHLTELARCIEEINSDPDCAAVMGSLVAGTDENGERTYRISRGMPQKRSSADAIFRKFGISADESGRGSVRNAENKKRVLIVM